MKVTYPFPCEQLTIKVTNEYGEDCTKKFMHYIANALFDAAKYNEAKYPLTSKDDEKMAYEIYYQLLESGYYDEE